MLSLLSKERLARATVTSQNNGAPASLFSTSPWCWDVTLVSPCAYTRKGWEMLFSEPAMAGTLSGVTIVDSVDALPPHASCPEQTSPCSLARSLIVHLPPFPLAALLFLLQLGGGKTCLTHYHQLIVCSPFPRGVTRTALMGTGIPGVVHIVPGRQSLAALYRTAMMPSPETFLHAHGKRNDLPCRLTPTERRVLQQSLCEVSVHWQAKLNFVSTKTIYTHRRNALAKFGCRSVMDLLKMFSA
ncbi:helix-turn-helix transcriptional regulator [Serratia marcescens]|nr:helix-turn-helix transcriptional regulator [Serratia marcescens]MBH3044368.1 helix-turn-helix transcriptional regulator [Serratia marcescens]